MIFDSGQYAKVYSSQNVCHLVICESLCHKFREFYSLPNFLLAKVSTPKVLSVLDGQAKCTMEAIDCNKIFYGAALKALKRDFDNPLTVAHSRLCSVFDQAQIKTNYKVSLRQFQQQLKCIFVAAFSEIQITNFFQRKVNGSHVTPTIVFTQPVL